MKLEIAPRARGIHACAAQIYEELAVAFTHDELGFIQRSGGPGKRAALWGMVQEAARQRWSAS